MLGNYSDYVFKILVIVAPILLILLVMIADRRREARKLIASGSPLAVPPSGPGDMEHLAAFLISLIAVPLLVMGGYNLIGEFRAVRSLEKRTMLVTAADSQHLESAGFGDGFQLLVELTGEVDGVTRHLQARFRSPSPMLPRKAEFDALEGQSVELWLKPDSSEFRMTNAFRWNGIGVTALGLAFLVVPGLTVVYATRVHRRRTVHNPG